MLLKWMQIPPEPSPYSSKISFQGKNKKNGKTVPVIFYH